MAFDPSAGVPAVVTSEKVELFLSCSDLKQKDLRSKSDPFIVIFLKDRRTGDTFKELGRTRVIYDNHYPKFPEQFLLDYYFEEEQTLRFDVYDEDKKGSSRLQDHDILGTCAFTLGEIVHSPSATAAKKLMHKGKAVKNKKTKKFSRLTVCGATVEGGADQKLTLKFSASKLPKMDFFGGADPFFEIWRIKKGSTEVKETLVYTSEVMKKTKDPKWKMFESNLQVLCNGDKTRSLMVQVFDWDKGGSADFIGQCRVSIDELLRGVSLRQLTDPSKKKKKSRGTLNIATTTHHRFLDFMTGGLDIGLVMAIDFTGSNMHPSHPKSLHYMSGIAPSPYQVAIRTIGSILSAYDSDQLYPVYGFGAKVGGVVSHCFACNFQSDAEVKGMSGVEAVYVDCLPKVQLYGPTWAHPVLDTAIEKARFEHAQFRKGVVPHLQYTVLMIMTDGAIMDLKETIDRVVTISNDFLPISIIIIGIANAPQSEAEARKQESEWAAMRILDADDAALTSSRGVRAKRDVVQFVKLTDYIRGGDINYADLSKETLAEIPKQFLSYTEFHKFSPPPRVTAAVSEDVFALSDEELRRDTTVVVEMGAPPSDAPSFTGPEPPLPDGWEKCYDEQGNTYFVDHSTQATSWIHPVIKAHMDSTATTSTAATTAPVTSSTMTAPSTAVGAATFGMGAMTMGSTVPSAATTTAAAMGGFSMGGSTATTAPMGGFSISGATAVASASTAPMGGSPMMGTMPMGTGAPMMGGSAPMGSAPTTAYGGSPGFGAMPGYAAPTYGVPTYGAPTYGAPTYGAPTYGAPTYGAPPTGMGATTAPMYGVAPATGMPMTGATAPYGAAPPRTGAAMPYGAPPGTYQPPGSYQPPPGTGGHRYGV